MPKKFDALVARARSSDVADKDDQIILKATAHNNPCDNKAQTHNSFKNVLQNIVSVCNNFGFILVRVTLSGNDARFWAADSKNKTAFLEAAAIISETYDADFALGSLDELLPLVKDDTLTLELEFGNRTVYKKADPDDDDSETITEIETVVKHLVFGRCKHMAGRASNAPKSTLKSEPNWTTICQVDNGSLDQFIKHATRLKRSAKSFKGYSEENILVFRIGQADESNVEVPIGICLKSDGVGDYSWKVETFIHLLKSALLSKNIVIMICKDTGLMRTDFAIDIGMNGKVRFQVIIPRV